MAPGCPPTGTGCAFGHRDDLLSLRCSTAIRRPGGWRQILRSGLAGGLALAMLAAAGAVAVVGVEVRPAAAAPDCGVATSERAALVAAAACERPIVVGPSRSEYAQVTAQPDGRLTFESAVVPQRARTSNGSWADVDLTLRPGADGLLRPLVSVADVAFSAGGSGPLATLRRSGHTLRLSWPGRLPAPVVTGDSVTYRNVRPDVDLTVRATPTGFSHVLVIKSARAAADPAVRSIKLNVGGDGRLDRLADGTLRVMTSRTVLAHADRALMWDSSRPVDSTAEPSTAVSAGDGARTASVATRVDRDGALRLIPDARLLDAPDVTFPVFVDPTWSVTPSKWAYATSNNCTNTDYSTARVGRSPETTCGGATFRSFFEFPTSGDGVSLAGKHVYSAHVQLRLTDSSSCADTPVNLYRTPSINATMQASWSAMTLSTWLASAAGHASESGCANSPQPDMTTNFIGGTVTGGVQAAADTGAGTFTVGVSARDADGTSEPAQNRWKKFLPDEARLVVEYDSEPGQPTGLQVSGLACPANGVLPVGTLSPYFSAVYPDADSGQLLTGTYEWIEVPAGGIGEVTDTFPSRQSPTLTASASANSRGFTASVTVTESVIYAYRVRTQDPEPYSRLSEWSAWCQFAADVHVPTVTVTMLTAPTGPGTPATFRIESPDTDVVSFWYGLNSATEPVPATGTGPRTAEVTLIAPREGRNILKVVAIDATQNEGSATFEFIVPSPPRPTANWHLETFPGVSQQQALADQLAWPADTPLTTTDVTWAEDLRLIGGTSASFNGTSSQAVTTQQVVDTTGSFSVAARVRLTALPSTAMTLASQEGTDAAGFELGVVQTGSPASPHWSFAMKDTSAQSSATRAALAPAAISATDAGRWVHLVGVYDRTAGKLRLYIDGTLMAEADRAATPWSAGGVFVVGRGFTAGAASNWWHGAVSDVHVHGWALTAQEIIGTPSKRGLLTPTLVGSWDGQWAIPCFMVDLQGACQVRDSSSFDRHLPLQRGADVEYGQRGPALQLDGYFFPYEFPEPWEPTVEWGRTAKIIGYTPPDEEYRQYTIWQDTPVLHTDDSYTVSVWANVDSTSRDQAAVSQTGDHESAFRLGYDHSSGKWTFDVTDADAPGSAKASVRSVASAQADTWVHLVGVYDASQRQITLYVNGQPVGSTALSWAPMSSDGPLQVGRSLWGGAYDDLWYGTVDDLNVYQGAMTAAAIGALYDAQAMP